MAHTIAATTRKSTTATICRTSICSGREGEMCLWLAPVQFTRLRPAGSAVTGLEQTYLAREGE